MAMKDIDLKLNSTSVQITASFEDMGETVRFGEACAALIRAAATGAPEEVQQRAGWLGRTLEFGRTVETAQRFRPPMKS